MAETSIASAIVVAEPDEDAPTTTNALKRRQSESAEDEQESKRQRTSPGKNSPTAPKDEAEQSAAAGDEQAAAQEQPKADPGGRRRPSIADEKQRSKRLFGALLGSLNQPRDRTSKRRQEIESRKKAELQRQDDERIEDKLRRQEKLTERRWREQVKVDEENMRARHDNLLHSANFLQTTAEPKLYYRPWDLRSDEEDRIDAQIKDARAQVDRELDESGWKHDREDQKTSERDSKQPAVDEPGKSPEQDQGASHEHPANLSTEHSKGTDEEGQVSAKSDDSKAAEVPDSDATNPNTNGNDTHESTHYQVALVSKEDEDQEDGVHDAGGDEDAVIY